jgi:hypothetical protein
MAMVIGMRTAAEFLIYLYPINRLRNTKNDGTWEWDDAPTSPMHVVKVKNENDKQQKIIL